METERAKVLRECAGTIRAMRLDAQDARESFKRGGQPIGSLLTLMKGADLVRRLSVPADAECGDLWHVWALVAAVTRYDTAAECGR